MLAGTRRWRIKIVERILNARPSCATLTGLNSEVLGQRTFDLAVIDEAAQSTEPVCWLPSLRCQSLVLAGDHCQLRRRYCRKKAADEASARMMRTPVNQYGSSVTRH